VRYKVVPPATSVDRLRGAHEALPLVPDTVEDCCTRIRDRTEGVRSRDEARELLTFLQALGLAGEVEEGFFRSRDPPADDALPAAFEEGVYGAREVLDALAEAAEPKSAKWVFETAVAPIVPRWERSHEEDWRASWRERTERLLGWGAIFGLVERVDGDRYRRVE